ncbi:hypothetical protein [Acidovorax sp. NCPPB 4044]|uniref:hypothetical protein n=1 Tax=Acidovorax sp. NCPPB 4044 TaxID=2940490 RepID=UPI002303D61C|nr:hypothetical protein [Acidovorax sp. NCPPB 4044]MDA8521544.1 hypothetical protein [Acidovorax sp. NCPPB 4044]
MRTVPRAFLLSAAVALAAGCASRGDIAGNAGASDPPDEVAVLQASTGSPDFLVAFIDFGEGDSAVALTNAYHARELRLRPGRYTVHVHCSTPRGTARPSLKVGVVAGQTYEVGCSFAGFGNDAARAGVKAIRPTTPPAPPAPSAVRP